MYENLRNELSTIATSKDQGKAAAANFWREYVCATFISKNMTAEDYEKSAKEVNKQLAELTPLSKAEKNSVSSAKSVLKKAAAHGVSPYVLDADGKIVYDEADIPKVKGKSELQDTKTEYQRIMASLGAVKNIMENAEVDFSKAECDSMANALVEIAAQVSKAANVSKGDDE